MIPDNFMGNARGQKRDQPLLKTETSEVIREKAKWLPFFFIPHRAESARFDSFSILQNSRWKKGKKKQQTVMLIRKVFLL